MSKPTLVILAAGRASRYGSMKQVAGFGPSGETIMDYSIYDAVRAGFGKIVFIIREQFEENFRSIFDSKLKGKVEIEYVFQELDMFTGNINVPEGRTKPWGTAHAVLCARDAVKEPFAVINADDFYGRDSFEKAASFLNKHCRPNNYAIVAYDLSSTLSDYGKVNRGVCLLSDKGLLAGIVERINIGKENSIMRVEDGLEPKELSVDTRVSMNFWCFDVSFFEYTQKLFSAFLAEYGGEPKSEFFIPIVADQFIREDGHIELLKTSGNWFGVTYKEDAPFVQKSMDRLISSGEYPSSLW